MTDGIRSRTTRHLTLGPDLAEAARGRRFIAEIASEAGFSEERVFDITVACSEAIANAIEHSPMKGEVQVRVILHLDRVEVQIEGPGEFQAPDRLKDRGNRGLGLPLMARLSDHLALFSGPRGETFVSLTFYRPGMDRRGDGALPPSFVNLSEENRLLDDVLQHSPDGFYVLDDGWRFAYANSALVVSLGCKADDLLGKVIWDVFPDFDPDARRALETSKAEHSVSQVVAVSRSGLCREWTAFPVEEGTAVYSRDITERRRAEDRVRQQSRLLDLSSDAILAWELDGPVVYWNAGAESLYGFKAQEAVGKVSHELLSTVHPEGFAQFRAALERDGAWFGEVEHKTKDGRTVTVDTRQQIMAVGGRTLVLETNRDITRRRRAEEEREELLAGQQELNEELAAINEELRCQTDTLLEKETALEAAERRFALALKNAPVSVAAMDRQLRYVWAYNQRTAAPDEVVDKTDRYLFPQEADALTRIKRKVISTGEEAHEGMWIHRPERRIFLDLHIDPMRDEAGEVVGLWIASVDLTDQMEAEAKSRELAAQRQLALDAAGLGWWHYDPISGISTWDKRYKEIFAVAEDARPNDEILSRLHPDDLPGVWASVEAALDPSDPKPYSAEYRIFLPDGALKWIEAHGIGTFEATETGLRATSLVGTVEDITARKNAEQALEFQARLLADVDDPMTATDENFVITFWNPAAERMFGRTAAEVVGRPGREVFQSRLEGASREDAVTDLMKTGTMRRVLYYTVADGSERPFEVHTAVLRDAEDKITGTISLQRDISERRRAEEERERLRLRQEDLSASLTSAYEDLQEQTEELAAANEELRTQTEELWRQEEALRESDERSRFLLKVAEAVAEWTDLDKVLEASLRAIVDATAHSRASIGLWDPKRLEIRVAASSGVEPLAPANAPLHKFSSAMQAAILKGRTVSVDYDRLPPEERQIADVYGARNGLLVPLTYHEQVIGVVMVDDPGERRPFIKAEIELIEGIARQVAVALENARLYEAQKKIAGQLQQAIMEMPVAVEGLEFSHLYRSATEEAIVGGDFYDVFDRTDGSIILLVGDVSGHGVNSAKVATMVKASLVALAQDGGEPAEVLAGVNKLLVHKRVPGFTSVLYAVYDPVSSTLRQCSAGHPNLLLGHVNRTVEFVGGNHAPLGVFPEWSCAVDGVKIQPGETLLFYTDGLTEARRGSEIFGEERLAQSFRRGLGLKLDDLPQMLLDEALAFSDGRLQDDLAILAVRRPSPTSPPR